MKLKELLNFIAMQMLGWSISIGATVVVAIVGTLILMSWVVTVAMIFNLNPPYKPIAIMAGIVVLAGLVVLSVLSDKQEK